MYFIFLLILVLQRETKIGIPVCQIGTAVVFSLHLLIGIR
jgi:hypothetical protein